MRNQIEALPFCGGVKLALTCGNCKWYEPFCDVCCNGDSEHRADFMDAESRCEEWEEQNEA